MTSDAYDRKPWLDLYPVGFRAEIKPAFHDMLSAFRNVVERRSRDAAILYFDKAISFADLDNYSDGFAAWLREQGVGRTDRVLIVLQNMPEFVIAIIGAWKVGAVPVPCNPSYRERELQLLVTDCCPKAIVCLDNDVPTLSAALTTARLRAAILSTSGLEFQTRNDNRVLPEYSAEKVKAESFLETLRRAGNCRPQSLSLSGDDLGCLLYTSGTTGTPKGAMLTHRGLAFNAQSGCQWFELGNKTRILGIAPLFHVTGIVLHVGAMLVCGGTLILTYRFHPGVVLDAMLEHRPTFSIGAITAYIALMHTPEASAAMFESFEKLYSGGAPIAPSVVVAFKEKFGRYIHSSCGMTELSAQSHLAPFGGDVPVDPASGALSIGIPTFNTEVRIVDEQGRSAPVGQPGELLVRGPQLMAGYWNKPADTAEALAGGWMHTGDVGFMDARGWFYLIDRKKDMISASGFKVWPREIEDVLYSHPAVREVAVVGLPDAYRGETVKACLALKPDKQTTPDELMAYCRERLAPYKVPRIYEIVAELPKTATGKIMRSAVREPR